MSNDFAKLFQSEELGQIAVMLTEQDDIPVISMYWSPEGYGICNVDMKFTNADEDEAWDKAEEALAAMTLEGCEGALRTITQEMLNG